jgi:hypothetical protein
VAALVSREQLVGGGDDDVGMRAELLEHGSCNVLAESAIAFKLVLAIKLIAGRFMRKFFMAGLWFALIGSA